MKSWTKLFISLVLVGVVIAVCVEISLRQESNQKEVTISIALAETPKSKLTSYYTSEELVIVPDVPDYALPLNLSQIANYDDVSYKLKLNGTGADTLLRNNGFVVIDYYNYREEDIIEPYKEMKEKGIPLFVTSDTLLHLYHIQFNEILKEVEEGEFFDDIKAMSKAMMEESAGQYDFLRGDLKEAAKRNTAYFAVGLKLLEPNASIPNFVEEEVNREIDKIEAHSGFSESTIFNYEEDYSQYVPRGHYTRSEKLKKYFKAMMWYGRMSFLLKGCDECYVSDKDAKIQTMQASLIAVSMDMNNVKADGKAIGEMWDRIYAVTSYFVGTADDLTPYEYKASIQKVFGSSLSLTDLGEEEKLLKLKAELAGLKSPKIYGGTGECWIEPPITEEKVDKCLSDTQGMRFMGQRFIPDSYIFQNLIFPTVYGRLFPKGLDVMNILGSKRAEEILREQGEYEIPGYEEQIDLLKAEFNTFNETEWNKNLYWSWLYTLKALLKDYDAGYPTFMQTHAWQDKELQTALASWTELRHDTILYAKQSYTVGTALPPEPKPAAGYVEPVPDFYSRLLALTRMTEEGLTDMNVLDQTGRNRLRSLEEILSELIDISKDELENRELTEEDYEFIRNFGERLDAAVAGVDMEGKGTTIVADVHTDINTREVLEEGVGYVDLILVAYKIPDGRIIIGAGPVFSYYEFEQPMSERLTDEEWKEMLKTKEPERPDWVKSFVA